MVREHIGIICIFGPIFFISNTSLKIKHIISKEDNEIVHKDIKFLRYTRKIIIIYLGAL